jgi:hypothetical protein
VAIQGWHGELELLIVATVEDGVSMRHGGNLGKKGNIWNGVDV